eukprot:7389271-Pyramimonas_sp.AAC.1
MSSSSVARPSSPTLSPQRFLTELLRGLSTSATASFCVLRISTISENLGGSSAPCCLRRSERAPT